MTLQDRTSISEEITVLPSRTCEANFYGVQCQSEANRIYPAFDGHDKWLCDDHFYGLLRFMRFWNYLCGGAA